jgi:carbonic anhydrase/acetyltransferase-like protein (isoleucine patch superfamily)
MHHFKLRKDLSIEHGERILYRIEALEDISIHEVKRGDIGGFVESEDNLDENAWVFDNAKVFDSAKVYGNAKVFGDAIVGENSEVYKDAKVFENAVICGSSKVSGNAEVYGYATVCGNAWVFDNAKVFDNAMVYDAAGVCGNAKVFDDAKAFDNATVYGDARVFESAKVFGVVRVFGNAEVGGSAELDGNALVCTGILKNKNDCISIAGERYILTITPEHIRIGCRCHTREEWWGFTDTEILKMDGKDGLKWWKTWKPIIMSICESNSE